MGIESGKIEVTWRTDNWGIRLDLLLIALAISASLISLSIDILYPGNSWFGRSGSIMVVIGTVIWGYGDLLF